MFALFTKIKNLINQNDALNSVSPNQAAIALSTPEMLSETKEKSSVQAQNDTTFATENTIALSQLTSKEQFCCLVLEEAIKVHRDWYALLEEALRSHDESRYNYNEDNCKLTQWLICNKDFMSQFPQYAVLMDMNRSFHDCTKEILRLHKYGHFAESILLLRRDLPVLSEEVERALHELYAQIHTEEQKAA